MWEVINSHPAKRVCDFVDIYGDGFITKKECVQRLSLSRIPACYKLEANDCLSCWIPG